MTTDLPDELQMHTTEEVADVFKVKATTVTRWIREGRLNATRPAGGRYKVTRAEMVRLAKEMYGTPDEETVDA